MAGVHKIKQTFARGRNLEKSYQYLCPVGDNPAKVSWTETTPVLQTWYETITIGSGRIPGSKRYGKTGVRHQVSRTEVVGVSGSLRTVISCSDGKKGVLLKKCSGDINIPAPGPFEPSSSNLQNEILKTMRRMYETGGVGRPPKSVGLGETLGEMSLSADRLTKSLLMMSPPIPRPTDKWNLWTPDEIAGFRKWKDVFHPLEILFGLYPVAGQTAELAFEAKGKMDDYAYKCGKWIKRLKKSSSGFKATVLENEIKKKFTPAATKYYSSVDESSRTSVHLVYLTGRMSCSDVSAFQMPYDIMQYVNESWAITLWDLTSFSYLFDRFTGGAVKKILRAAIDTEARNSSGGWSSNSTLISLNQVQVHTLMTTSSEFKVSSLESFCGSGSSIFKNYNRTAPDEVGSISESFNGAQAIADLFTNPITPLNGWSPTQYLDVLFLFIPPIVLKST